MNYTEENNYDSQNGDNVDSPVDSDASSDLEQTSIIIGLNKAGEKGSGYHTRNDPSAPLQRATVTERRGLIQVRLKSREIVHGRLSTDGENATLLIYDFTLDTTKRSRRIRSATLKFEFKSSVTGVPTPEVHAIAPAGRTTLMHSTQEEILTRGAELNVGASQIMHIGGTMRWEKTVSSIDSDNARVTGYIFSDNYGKGVGATWNLYENTSKKSGTPTFLRCAILLNRRYDQDKFECSIKVKAEADWKSEMGHFLGPTVYDDPLLFDPTLPPTNKLRKEGYDTESLGGLKLDDFVQVAFDRPLGTEAVNIVS